MSEEWGPWIEWRGGRRPIPPGTYAQLVYGCGFFFEGPVGVGARSLCGRPSFAGEEAWLHAPGVNPIIRYRIRKPKALEQLRKIARDVETPLVNTPKEPVRA